MSAACVLGLLVFVFKDRRFRGNTVQIAGALVLGVLVAAGWYVTGHLGYGENPETLEHTYFATNTRTLESLSFVAPLAYTLELLMLWTDKSLHSPSHRQRAGRDRRVGGLRAGHAQLPLGRFRFDERHAQPAFRRHADGLRRRHGDGLHDRPGAVGLSTLAIGSVIAVAGIMTGSAATLKYILWKTEQE